VDREATQRELSFERGFELAVGYDGIGGAAHAAAIAAPGWP
jgi:hypothetical protein